MGEAVEDAAPTPTEDQVAITFYHHNSPMTLNFVPSSSLIDLSEAVSSHLSIPPTHQKWLITPQVGLVRSPFPSHPLSDLLTKRLVLMGSTPTEISTLDASVARSLEISTRPSARPRAPRPSQSSTKYTFTTLLPLQHLPNSHLSLRFLSRLRDDPGIRAAMTSHRWTVPVLTEMDPAEHTTHESRTLGLNRNRGEVIELRLRTDAGDGYRDYKTIRRTLCHELAHNVWGEHDARFWKLCGEIEKEVERGDWTSGGRSVGGGGESYIPPEERGEEHVDVGAWEGGEYVLGGAGEAAGLSRREILARAAEERLRKQRDSGGVGEGSA